MGTLDWLSDNLIELQGPVDIAADAAFNTNATVTAKLYDTQLDCRISDHPTTLAEDYVSGPVITVTESFLMLPDAVILIDVGKGRFVKRTVQSQSGDDVTLTVDLGAARPAGTKIRIHTYAIGTGFLGLDNADGWDTDMTLELTHSNGVTAEFNVGWADQISSIIWLDGSPLGVTVLPGALVKRKIGGNIALSNFGSFPASNPAVGDPTWGFRGTINDDHPDIALGMRIRGEITAVNPSGGSLNLTRKAVATVIKQ